jgi:hypothetical protein
MTGNENRSENESLTGPDEPSTPSLPTLSAPERNG